MVKKLEDIVGRRPLEDIVKMAFSVAADYTKKPHVADPSGYYPKSGDEQEFVDKHKIEKTADANGNDDDVFNGSDIEHVQKDPKEKKHGYKNPQDKKASFKPAGASVKEGFEDYEGEMARTQLRALANKAMSLSLMMKDDNAELEAWLQSKIAQAKQMIDSVHDYLVYSTPSPIGSGNNSMDERRKSAGPLNTIPSKNLDSAAYGI